MTMDRDRAVTLIKTSGLAGRAHRILPHLRAGMRITATRDVDATRTLSSRFAGTPVLPRGSSWPTWDTTAYHKKWLEYFERDFSPVGRPELRRATEESIAWHETALRQSPKPLHFLALVRLADVFGFARSLDLPDEGALVFFYDMETSPSFRPEAMGAWRVFYARDDELELVDNPPTQPMDFIASTLSFAPQYSLPEDLRDETGDDDLVVSENEEYTRIHAALLGGADSQVVHQLGGAPQEIQDGLFLQCQLVSHGVVCESPSDYESSTALRLAPGAQDWRLLLQIDSDDDGPGWLWGDSGRLYFCIEQDALKQRQFDRVWCVEQSC